MLEIIRDIRNITVVETTSDRVGGEWNEKAEGIFIESVSEHRLHIP
jgi:hypothetical protein